MVDLKRKLGIEVMINTGNIISYKLNKNYFINFDQGKAIFLLFIFAMQCKIRHACS